METRKTVFNKLFNKVELKSEKVELSLSNDIKNALKITKGLTSDLEKNYNKMDKILSEYKKIYENNKSDVRLGEDYIDFINKTIVQVDKMAKELGVDSSKVQGYKDLETRRDVLKKMLPLNKRLPQIK